METKICTKCKIEKSREDFYKATKRKDGLRQYCKTCENLANRSRENDGRYRDRRKKYRQDNAEDISLKQQKKYDADSLHRAEIAKLWRQTPNGRLNSYQRSAKARDLSWEITTDQFMSFFNLPCEYCGDLIEGVGIDRVDSSIGYIQSNLVPCCSLCNIMKMHLDYEVFTKQISKIKENLKL